MTRIRAFVVGIAKHADSRANVQGPEESAMRIADWLLGLANAELELHLFLSEDAALTAAIASGLADKRVILHCTTAQEIKDFAYDGIKDGLVRGTRLFVFWSGHGTTCSATDDRIFMCGDFVGDLPDRVFNASGFLRRMRTAGHAFTDELMLADVCGPFRLRDEMSIERVNQIDIPQVSCFASRAGKYVKTVEAGGKFTDVALRVLSDECGYPADLERVVSRIADALDTPDGVAVRLVTSTRQKFSEQIVGGKEMTSLPYLDSALALLRRIAVTADDYRFHYERTAVAMKFPTISRTSGVREVLTHLCDLRDDVDVMPFGLLQFIMRLSEVARHPEVISEWLDTEAQGQYGAREKVRQLLDAEHRRKVVLFVVEEKNGALNSVRPYLCGTDGLFRSGHAFPSVVTQCKDWVELEAIVRRTLAEFQVGEGLPELEVHFAVDPPLLDRPFHRIVLEDDGEPIGAVAPVFLRHRTRLLCSEPDRLDNWEAYAAMLRTKRHGDLKWIRIGPELPLPEEQGLCYAGFTLPHPTAGVAPCIPQKRILNRLLTLGTPVLYVRHTAPPGGAWDVVGTGLGKLTADLLQVDGFARAFHNDRVRGTDLAMEASLVWDDPHTNPFTPTYGTSDIELSTS